jgi:IMP dehydrogenase
MTESDKITYQKFRSAAPALTFDDVLLVPRKSSVLPGEVSLSARLTEKIRLNLPVISSAMDTVTEYKLATAMALEGGLGIIHKNMPADEQAEEIRKVKKFSSWIITNPITLSPEDTIAKAMALRAEHNISGFPVVENSMLVGIITGRDLKFKKDYSLLVKEVMTHDPVTAGEDVTIEQALSILDRHKIEKLPIVDKENNLKGLITFKDIEKTEQYPNSCKDDEGSLMVGAAVGPADFDRAKKCFEAGADVIIVDTAHGHSANVINAIRKIKKALGVDVIGGNVATSEATEELISAGADAVKVGIGPGSICTTRVVAGVGVPQISAILECSMEADKHNIPIIADGGIHYSGDISKALGAGASTVMIGNLLAGTDESPGRYVYVGGRKYKQYRGMGSISAMKLGSKDRYGQREVTDSRKLVAEGVEGIVPYKGTVKEVLFQLTGGIRAAMGYCGTPTIEELRKKAQFVTITAAGLKESHPHDLTITEEAPNYSMISNIRAQK